MFGYFEGCAAGPELEEYVKKCKKLYTSHHRIGINVFIVFLKSLYFFILFNFQRTYPVLDLIDFMVLNS
jgi:hypothetical protein